MAKKNTGHRFDTVDYRGKPMCSKCAKSKIFEDDDCLGKTSLHKYEWTKDRYGMDVVRCERCGMDDAWANMSCASCRKK